MGVNKFANDRRRHADECLGQNFVRRISVHYRGKLNADALGAVADGGEAEVQPHDVPGLR